MSKRLSAPTAAIAICLFLVTTAAAAFADDSVCAQARLDILGLPPTLNATDGMLFVPLVTCQASLEGKLTATGYAAVKAHTTRARHVAGALPLPAGEPAPLVQLVSESADVASWSARSFRLHDGSVLSSRHHAAQRITRIRLVDASGVALLHEDVPDLPADDDCGPRWHRIDQAATSGAALAFTVSSVGTTCYCGTAWASSPRLWIRSATSDERSPRGGASAVAFAND